MHILLINTNPVVSRLIALCSREDGMTLEEVTRAGSITRDRYDVLFVDEVSYTDETGKVLSALMVKKTVYLTSKNETNVELASFDRVIKKPFLPSTIIEVLESVDGEVTEDSEEVASMFPLTTDEEVGEYTEDAGKELLSEEMVNELKVLDSSEIEKIKILLEMEKELEAVSTKLDEVDAEKPVEGEICLETETYDEDTEEKSLVESIGKKAKKNGESKKEEEEHAAFEETLLEAIERMKVKKIKKLLKGAEVTITIKFKDEE